MPRYRKKPVEIVAELARSLIAAAASAWDSLPEWIVSAYDAGEIIFRHDGIDIRTLEGVMTADPDDMVICGTRGEIYPCKPGPFADSYEPVV